MKTWLIILAILLPFQGSAQKNKPARTPKTTSAKTTTAFQPGKNYAYFPDYYAFYDPARGYVYWDMQSNKWQTSQEMPLFMSKVDMSKVRVKIIDGLTLDLYPERNYPYYMKLYPAQLDDPKVPVPNGTGIQR
ncbi:MAG TPA: hypothetical protein VL093_07185 [Flavipsychrobacter sp.]|jgi:hypothetical protein|nr:hypothetical protein [Flavipsychrobacter sp.]